MDEAREEVHRQLELAAESFRSGHSTSETRNATVLALTLVLRALNHQGDE
jgi:hypothetical protein